jgi:flagellar basal body-associated protein FliL
MAEEQAPAAARRKFPIRSILVLAVIMLVEGGAFSLWMIFSGPAEASAGQVAGVVDAKPTQRTMEIKVLEFRGTNTKTGRTIHYDLEIAVECEKEKGPIVEDLCKKRDAKIRDELAPIVRRADPQHMQEPDLETLRRQIGATLTEIFGEGVIEKVLIPRCTPFRADY